MGEAINVIRFRNINLGIRLTSTPAMTMCFPCKDDDDEEILSMLGTTINSVVCSKARLLIN